MFEREVISGHSTSTVKRGDQVSPRHDSMNCKHRSSETDRIAISSSTTTLICALLLLLARMSRTTLFPTNKVFELIDSRVVLLVLGSLLSVTTDLMIPRTKLKNSFEYASVSNSSFLLSS